VLPPEQRCFAKRAAGNTLAYCQGVRQRSSAILAQPEGPPLEIAPDCVAVARRTRSTVFAPARADSYPRLPCQSRFQVAARSR